MAAEIFKYFHHFFCTLLILFGATSFIPANAKDVKIVAFGDSLTAGYQLSLEDAFPAKLQVALIGKGHSVAIVNAGVSGDTTADGLNRLDWSVPDDVDAVILELGANDALRGVDPAQTRRILEEIVQRLDGRNVEILICGMLAPPNMGQEYETSFNSIFQEVADKYDTLYFPFFLEGVAAMPELNLEDGMHPNARGVEVIVENILPFVEQLIARVKKEI